MSFGIQELIVLALVGGLGLAAFAGFALVVALLVKASRGQGRS